MLLNQTNSQIQICKLLENPSVYKYEDVTHEETVGETVTVVVDKTALAAMQDDILDIADEVYLSEILSVITTAHYDSIKATVFTSYTANQKRMFYAECYFVASKFLIKWSLKNETEMYKSTLDFNSRTVGVEKSGKLFTAEEYARTAKSNMAEFEREYYAVDADLSRQSSISIGRY